MTVERVWAWDSGCCSGHGPTCLGQVAVHCVHERLEYRGFCGDPGFGGEYHIGSQTVGEFEADGPLVPMPEAVISEVGRRPG